MLFKKLLHMIQNRLYAIKARAAEKEAERLGTYTLEDINKCIEDSNNKKR